ncbi:hypothetical protein [Achromobacter pulmonis]|uniref:hypothetical protein n=1 Tax=Achromobacter pulmonis TaxID=1389932 RepID=UPI001F38E66F|nr:hypothetical protein [Achromobacter pulmonis]MCF7768963.1 hypothetical protein [Achromobacter pulmonis]
MDESVVAAIHELANALAGLGSWQQQLVSMTILLVVAAAGSNEMVSPIPTKRYAEWGLFFLGDLS